MGVPVVGERHHGKANTSQGAVGMFGAISKRISGMCGSRCSSVNNQQSIQAKDPAENNREYSLGALLSRGASSQRDIDARCVSCCMPRIGFSRDGETSFWRKSRLSRWNAGYEQQKLRTGPKPRSSASCRLCFRTQFAGSSVATIQFHREYQLERGGREGRALACASVRSVRSLP